MKIALLLIPATEKVIFRNHYLSMCIERVMEEGYMPLTPSLYEQTAVNQADFIECVLPYVDAIYLFVNFGIDRAMFEVIDRAIDKIMLRYRRIPESTINTVFHTSEMVLWDVCRKTGFTPDDLKSKSRKREIVDARFVYFRRAKEVTKASLAMIGNKVNKDHATVLHGIKEANETHQVLELYNKCYGETKIEAAPMVASSGADGSTKQQPVERPVLPFRSLDPREQTVPSGKPFVQALSGRGFNSAYSGYRPHNS